ncbi:MAG TPA: hypothetical protein VFB58_00825 [Chloroflexota bacterium]|nr:hypothetical protein [Chloroflexota bacterium]
MSMNRENIERKEDAFVGGPSEGWQQMEDTAVEAEKGAPLWNKGMEGVSTEDHEPHGSDYVEGGQSPPAAQGEPETLQQETVQRSGDLTHPVGTESDSY